jgi:hypothetical protein
VVFVMTKVLELAGRTATDNHHVNIVPGDIRTAVFNQKGSWCSIQIVQVDLVRKGITVGYEMPRNALKIK